MSVWIPLLICIVGLIAYALSNNQKVQAIALHSFWVGLLVFLLHWAGSLPLPKN